MLVMNDVCADDVRLDGDVATVRIHMHTNVGGRDVRAIGDARVRLVVDGAERVFRPDGNHAGVWITGDELLAALDSLGNDDMRVWIDQIAEKARQAALEQTIGASPGTVRGFEL
jgi:hypothetical protein